MSKKVFNMQGGKHSAAAYTELEKWMYGSVVANVASFVVSAGTGMNLNISTGAGLISDTIARRIGTDAVETAAVPTASASFNRIDTVVAYIDTAVAPTTAVTDNTNDILKFKVVAGTAASTPIAPTGAAIITSIGAGKPYIVLYDVLVPQNATNTSSMTLTDRRVLAGIPLTAEKQVELKTSWADIAETHTFSSFNSATRVGVITIPAGGTSKYTVGMKYRGTQSTGGTKYGFIVAVTSTTLSVFFGLGITLNNEAITAPAYATDFVPTGYTGPQLTKKQYQSDTTNSERWVYQISGWGVMFTAGGTTAAQSESVPYGMTFATNALVVANNAGDNSVNGGYGSGGNTVEGRLNAKTGSQSTTGFAMWIHTSSGSNFAAGYSYYTWNAEGPVA